MRSLVVSPTTDGCPPYRADAVQRRQSPCIHMPRDGLKNGR